MDITGWGTRAKYKNNKSYRRDAARDEIVPLIFQKIRYSNTRTDQPVANCSDQ